MNRFIAALNFVGFALVAPLVSASSIELLVPAYFYPASTGSAWDQLIAAASAGTPVTAIMNPGGGPGTTPNADYASAVNQLRAAGGHVLGYVPSGYFGQSVNLGSSCQPASGSAYNVADVVGCASRSAQWYNVDGIFFDEFTNTDSPAALSFYESIYAGLKSLNSGWRVVGNPGSATVELYLNDNGARSADTLVVFENSTGYPNYQPSAWNAQYPAQNFGHLLYNVATPTDLLSAIALAQSRNAGYVYATDDQGLDFNPWDTLPAYWNRETAAIRQANIGAPVSVPDVAWLILLGLPLIFGCVRKRS